MQHAEDRAENFAVAVSGGARTRGRLKTSRPGRPLISVLTVVKNAKAGLEKTLQSVVGQTYDNVEYIVVDGCSTDGTVDVLREHDDQVDYWISEKDSGLYVAMNKGVRLCTGDYVGIIGAGDWYERNALEAIAAVISRDHSDVVYGDVEVVDPQTGISYFRRSNSDGMPRTMSSISHPTVFTERRHILNGPFDTRYRIAADYDFCLSLYKKGAQFTHCGALVAHIFGSGLSARFRTQYEVFRIHQKNYGLVHASMRLALSTMRHNLMVARRKVLETILSPARFAAAREWWWRRKRDHGLVSRRKP